MSVAVVTPCFNQGQFLAQCIWSVAEQTLPPDRYVIVDDGSTDNSWYVARPFEESFDGLTVLRVTNRGLPGARNAGLLAVGEVDWVAFIDADDWFQPDWLEKTVWCGEKLNADVVMTERRGTDGHRWTPTFGASPEDWWQYCGGNSCALIRRTALVEAGGYNPRMWDGDEDWDLWYDLALRGAKFARQMGTWYNYRVHAGQWTRTVTGERKSDMREEMRRHHGRD